MNYSIIIPNFNGAKFLPSCLDSIYKNIKKNPETKFEIIFVDNHSQDNSCQILEEINSKYFLKNIEYLIIKNNQNLGYAKAVNQGIEKSKFDWVAVLNNDLNLDLNWFSIVKKTEIHHNIAAICGTVLNYDGSIIESQGMEFFYSGKAKNIYNGQKFFPNIVKGPPRLVWGASGAATIYNKKVLTKIGKFDENFFAYEEDVDLSLRLNKLNYKTLLIPNCISYHLGGGTSNKMGNFRSFHDTKNWYFIILKNFSAKELISNLPNILIERLKNVKYLAKNTHPKYKIPFTILNLYFTVARNIPKIMAERKQMQKLLK